MSSHYLIRFSLVVIPASILATIFVGLVHIAVQQDMRQGANDPQIQMAEDTARALSRGEAPASLVPMQIVDISESLAPFLIVYDDSGRVIASSATFHGVAPTPPSGVFDYARTYGEDRLTWQPQAGVRHAIIVTRFSGASSGFVLAGRSLLEVEKRESGLGYQTLAAWLASLVTIFFTALASAWFVAR